MFQFLKEAEKRLSRACSPRDWSSCCSKSLLNSLHKQLSRCERMVVHSDMFGDDCVTFKDRNASVTVDGVAVSIDTQTRVSPPAPAHVQHHLHVQFDL